MSEVKGKFWRELIRVEKKDNHTIMIVIPAWHPTLRVDFKIGEFGEEIWEKLHVGGRYFAMVNSCVQDMADIEIRDIELQNVSPVCDMNVDYIKQNAKSIPIENLVEEIIRLRLLNNSGN